MEDVISSLRNKYEKAYGFAVFDLDCRPKGDRMKVSGKVLTENQKDEALASISSVWGKKIEDGIKVLSNVKTKEIGWAVVKAKTADLRSRFVESGLLNEKISNRIRASQAGKGEILRIIFQKERQLLVQLPDLSMGWINRNDVIIKKGSLRKEWRKGKLAEPEKLIAVPHSRNRVLKEAESFLGVRYILGGRSSEGIDCSALIQLAYKKAFGIILPRHSWDQKKMGKKIDFDEAETGDLIFMLNRKTDTRHIGMFDISSEGQRDIVHSSFSRGKVVRERVEEVLKNYELVEARRIIKK